MTAIKIVSKRVDNLTEYEVRRCRTLTLGNMGEMRDEFNRQRRLCAGRPGSTRARVFMAKYGSTIVGWAMSFYPEYCSTDYPRSVHFYVAPAWRNNGIGTRLMNSTYNRIGPIHVFPHDTVSGGFFNKNIDKAHNRSDVEWYA